MPFLTAVPPSNSNVALQMASHHSQLVHPPAPPAALARSADMIRIKEFLETYSASCIACWLLQRNPDNDHQLKECTLCDNPFTTHQLEFQKWCGLLNFPQGTCFTCACPQHVRSFPLLRRPLR
jgi:hypothetical protein